MVELFRKKHELWLEFLFGSFALPRGEAAEMLYDFANIQYRHLKWLAKAIVKSGRDFDWNRALMKCEFKSAKELYERLSDKLMALELEYGEGALFDRIRSDERYMQFCLQKAPDIAVSAFDRNLSYKSLDKTSLDALVLFLLEESYKEYELILTYTYSQIHTEDADISLVFEDLVYESMYHLKSFALLMAKLGILSVPRPVMEEVYKFEDLKKFLEDGIEEEKAAKEECKKLSQAIKDEELSRFFDFINNQEDYHIELMQEVLAKL
jgi:hypothetical protein